MVTLRLTRRLQKLLDIGLAEPLKPTTSKLGDWYANLVPTFAGDLIIFVNERSLLSVAVPIWESDNLLLLFRLRFGNLLGMIGILPEAIDREIRHYSQIQFGNTRSRSILGSMNDFAFRYQVIADEAKKKADLSLTGAEYEISQIPCKPLDFRAPADVVKELLAQ